MYSNRCGSCQGLCNPVAGTGPEPASVMLIGDRPSAGYRPASGKWAKELDDNYLWLAGMRRADVRLTNTVKCPGERKASETEIQSCATAHLPQEIADCSPSVIVLMGSVACSLIPDLDLDLEHGIPFQGELFGWKGMIVPMLHPAIGLRDTTKMIPLLEDFERLRSVLDGSWAAPVDQYPVTDYRIVHSEKEIWDSLGLRGAEFFRGPMAIDTERHGDTPYSLQYSVKPGTGYLIRCADTSLMKYLAEFITSRRTEVVLHNAPQDINWLARMGIQCPVVRDTMQEAYHLGNLPQGLKALAYRLLGIRMTNYSDIVIPYSRETLGEWLIQAAMEAMEDLTYITQKQLKTKVKEIEKPSLLERGFRRIYTYSDESAKYDPWKALDTLFGNAKLTQVELDWTSANRSLVPIAGIAHVPEPVMVQYACADADITLRIALELGRRRGIVMQSEMAVADGDEDQ